MTQILIFVIIFLIVLLILKQGKNKGNTKRVRKIAEFEANLYKTGSSQKFGEVEWEEYADGNKELEVQIFGTNLPVYELYINDTKVTDTDPTKPKQFIRTSEGKEVPAVKDGDVIIIRQNGFEIARGAFHRDR